MAFNIVLVEPEIPGNTGNISRTCAATGTHLHLVRPLGFTINDKTLKRAGLDYWDKLNVTYYDAWSEVVQAHPEGRFFFASTKAHNTYADMTFQDGDFLVFGKETKGLPEAMLVDHADTAIRVPMRETLRSLNLASSVAIVLYEALRQTHFTGLR
jgi:tRNA (cytidine/uridine-2'-O-)-methyltransferase